MSSTRARLPRTFALSIEVPFLLGLALLPQTGSSAAPGGAQAPKCRAESGDRIELTEFRPPQGRGQGNPAREGPGPRRILLATSRDGVTFTRTGRVLSDQANTPNMVVDANGRILVYYTAYDIDATVRTRDGSNRDGIAVAVSEDGARTWRHFCAGMTGFAVHRPPIGDPDVVKLPDGSYRLFVTNGGPDGTINILSATSRDGLHFTYEGIALETHSNLYKDSLTAPVGAGWVMYALRSDQGRMVRAVSSDGIHFRLQQEEAFYNSGGARVEPFILSNWMRTDSGQRIFAFAGESASIMSFTSNDGTAFIADRRVVLGPPFDVQRESRWVKDAAVQKLADGTYLMAYVSEIP